MPNSDLSKAIYYYENKILVQKVIDLKKEIKCLREKLRHLSYSISKCLTLFFNPISMKKIIALLLLIISISSCLSTKRQSKGGVHYKLVNGVYR